MNAGVNGWGANTRVTTSAHKRPRAAELVSRTIVAMACRSELRKYTMDVVRFRATAERQNSDTATGNRLKRNAFLECPPQGDLQQLGFPRLRPKAPYRKPSGRYPRGRSGHAIRV